MSCQIIFSPFSMQNQRKCAILSRSFYAFVSFWQSLTFCQQYFNVLWQSPTGSLTSALPVLRMRPFPTRIMETGKGTRGCGTSSFWSLGVQGFRHLSGIHFPKNSLGVRPVIFLNKRVKWWGKSKPSKREVSLMLWPFISRLLAWLMT